MDEPTNEVKKLLIENEITPDRKENPMTDELPIETKKAIIGQQLTQYRGSIYLMQLTHRVNKSLGNADKMAELEKELVRLNREMEEWKKELDTLKEQK